MKKIYFILLIVAPHWSCFNNKTQTSVANQTNNCLILKEDFDFNETMLGKLQSMYKDFLSSSNKIDILKITLSTEGLNVPSAVRIISRNDKCQINIYSKDKEIIKDDKHLKDDALFNLSIKNLEIGSFNFDCGNDILFSAPVFYFIKIEGKIIFKLRTTTQNARNIVKQNEIPNAVYIINIINKKFP